MDITGADLRPIARRLRELVLDVHPDAVEVVRLGDRAATDGLGPPVHSEGIDGPPVEGVTPAQSPSSSESALARRFARVASRLAEYSEYRIERLAEFESAS